MINWSVSNVTPPPLLSHLSNDELRSGEPILIHQIPCHSQAVERAVKDITDVSLRVYGHKARHGMLLQRKKSRQELPHADTKGDFLARKPVV
jgi:hypothetical protein